MIPVISLMQTILSYRLEVYMRPTLYISLLLLLVSGCTQGSYYYQAVTGQAKLIFSQQAIEDLDLGNSAKLADRLADVEQMLAFAESRLQLPSGKRFKSYVQLEENFVLWNVVSATEFSTEPEQWCFPVAGCVSYRGYFQKRSALEFADQMQLQGLDVHVGGVAAYSTLGWFNDPLLSSYLFWPVPSLAGLLFHELAHSKMYLAGDSSFNEAFASFVEQEGLRQYMQKHANVEQQEAWNVRQVQRKRFNDYLLDWKNELALLYAQPIPELAKRLFKQGLMKEIENCYARNKDQFGSGIFDGYFSTPLNNARLGSLAAYNAQIGVFEELFERSNSWYEFYTLAQRLGDLPQAQRTIRVSELLELASNAQNPLSEIVITNASDRQHSNKVQCNTFSYHGFNWNVSSTKNDGVGRSSNR